MLAFRPAITAYAKGLKREGKVEERLNNLAKERQKKEKEKELKDLEEEKKMREKEKEKRKAVNIKAEGMYEKCKFPNLNMQLWCT